MEILARQCVQLRLACSAGDSPTGGRVRTFLAWVAFGEETNRMKPTDACERDPIGCSRQARARCRIRGRGSETGASPLTDREADVLRAAVSGRSTAEIGSLLNLSPATVRYYLSNAISRLGARNRMDAVRIAEELVGFDPGQPSEN